MADLSWWAPLLEPGDPLWFNYPDSPPEPYRFIGIVPEGEHRAGQIIFDEYLPPRPADRPPDSFMAKGRWSEKPEGEWVRKISWNLLPVPINSKPYEEVQAGKWKGTREELIKAWDSLDARLPPQTWLDLQLAKVSNGA